MSARIDSAGTVYQLDRRAEPDERVTEGDVKDVRKLSLLLMRILKDVVLLKRRWWPKRIDFEDRTVDATGTTKYRFPHNFNARIRWWPVDQSGYAQLKKHAESDLNTLVLVSGVACTVTIRVEVA